MAIALDGLGDPAAAPAFNAGLWTVQDTGAQLVGLAAAPRAGQRILDACAGVGGKSTHLAELAVTPRRSTPPTNRRPSSSSPPRARRSASPASGVTSATCSIRRAARRAYDLIVLDAPCTGLGVLRPTPTQVALEPGDVPRLAQLQRSCRRRGPAPRTRRRLLYSVCTFTRAEGPPDRSLSSAPACAWCPSTGHAARADAFYLARLEREHA